MMCIATGNAVGEREESMTHNLKQRARDRERKKKNWCCAPAGWVGRHDGPSRCSDSVRSLFENLMACFDCYGTL